MSSATACSQESYLWILCPSPHELGHSRGETEHPPSNVSIKLVYLQAPELRMHNPNGQVSIQSSPSTILLRDSILVGEVQEPPVDQESSSSSRELVSASRVRERCIPTTGQDPELELESES